MSEDTPDTGSTQKPIRSFGGGAITGLTNFRFLLKDYIGLVLEGKRILLLRNDEPVALVIPIEEAERLGLMPKCTQEIKKALEEILAHTDLSLEEMRERIGTAIDML